MRPGPDAEEGLAALRAARDPDLAVQLLGLDGAGARQRMRSGHGDDELALGEEHELERVRRPERRRLGEDREVERARPQRRA